MWWILFVVVQALVIVSGIRNEQRAGLWSWSKFAFALGFAALEVILVLVPLNYIGLEEPLVCAGYDHGERDCSTQLRLDDHRGAPLETPRRPDQSASLPGPAPLEVTLDTARAASA